MNSIYKIIVGAILGAFVRKSLNKLKNGQALDRAELHELVERQWREHIQVQARPIKSMSDLDRLWNGLDAQAKIEPAPESAMGTCNGRF